MMKEDAERGRNNRESILATAARHQEISETFLEHAEEEFNKGDLLQASEKAWGAFAHYVKSIARERGWPNKSHQDVRDNAAILMRYTSDPGQSRGMFLAIDALHTNFYEEYYEEETVWRGIEYAEALINALRSAEPDFPRERPQVKRGRVSNSRARRRRG